MEADRRASQQAWEERAGRMFQEAAAYRSEGLALQRSEAGDFISGGVTGSDSSCGKLSRCPAEGLEGIPAQEITNSPVREGDVCGLGDHPSRGLPRSQAEKWTPSTLAPQQAGLFSLLTLLELSSLQQLRLSALGTAGLPIAGGSTNHLPAGALG